MFKFTVYFKKGRFKVRSVQSDWSVKNKCVANITPHRCPHPPCNLSFVEGTRVSKPQGHSLWVCGFVALDASSLWEKSKHHWWAFALREDWTSLGFFFISHSCLLISLHFSPQVQKVLCTFSHVSPSLALFWEHKFMVCVVFDIWKLLQEPLGSAGGTRCGVWLRALPWLPTLRVVSDRGILGGCKREWGRIHWPPFPFWS